jgi:hypothetical protein
MKLQERERELDAFDEDEEYIATLISEFDTRRLHILVNAIGLELKERYEGKPRGRTLLH